jgi:DNA-binding MarR family transcriptional regulator
MENVDSNIYHIWANMVKFRRKLRSAMINCPDLELTRTQFYLLKLIEHEEPCKMSYLAEMMGVKPSVISTMIDRLEQNGLVVREYRKTDRRSVFVSLTDQGREVLNKELELSKQVVMNFLSHLAPHELESLAAILEKIVNDENPASL